MKAESSALAGQRKTNIMRRKREQTQTMNFLSVFSYSSNVFVCWFHLYGFAFGVKPFFRTHPKMGAAIFICPYISVYRLQLTS